MSSILKALKKLEDEKRKPDALQINSEILRDIKPSRSYFSAILVAAVIFLGGGATVYLIMDPSAEISAKRTEQNPDPRPPLSSTSEKPQKQLQTEITKKENTSAAQSQPLLKKNATYFPAVVPPRKPVTAQQEKKPTTPVQPSIKPPKSLAPHNQVPALKVNGIAFQEQSADRVAVVNGVTVSNGSVIEGVHVEDIQRNRISFSYGGEKFDIGLGKENR